MAIAEIDIIKQTLKERIADQPVKQTTLQLRRLEPSGGQEGVELFTFGDLAGKRLQGVVVPEQLDDFVDVVSAVYDRAYLPTEKANNRMSSSFSHQTLESLTRNPELVVGVIREYQIAFAAGDQWAEFCVCASCSRSFSTENILQSVQQDSLSCCDQPQLTMKNSTEKVLGEIVAELNKNQFESSYMITGTTQTDQTQEVDGFMWGCSDNENKLVNHMVNKYFSDLDVHQQTALRDKAMDALSRLKGRSSDKDTTGSLSSYVSEIAVRQDMRKGGELLARILKEAVDDQYPQGVRHYFFWTQPNSNIYNVILALKGEVLLQVSDLAADDRRVIMGGSVEDLRTILNKVPPDQVQRYIMRELLAKRREQSSQ